MLRSSRLKRGGFRGSPSICGRMKKRSLGSVDCASATKGAASSAARSAPSVRAEVVGEGSAPRYPWVPAGAPSVLKDLIRGATENAVRDEDVARGSTGPCAPARAGDPGPLVNGGKTDMVNEPLPSSVVACRSSRYYPGPTHGVTAASWPSPLPPVSTTSGT